MPIYEAARYPEKGSVRALLECTSNFSFGLLSTHAHIYTKYVKAHTHPCRKPYGRSGATSKKKERENA
jgi:hypothetical protein